MNTDKSENGVLIHFTLMKDTLLKSFSSSNTSLPGCEQDSACALWLQSGGIKINECSLSAGDGLELNAADSMTCSSEEPSVIYRFIVTPSPVIAAFPVQTDAAQSELVSTQSVVVESTACLLRLDQVDFPPSAIAYKHTHPGPGIRYLVKGGLTLSSEHGEQSLKPGDVWFEGANTPVMATAISTMPSQFVRTMLLPLEYEGRSTFTLHNETDANKPRLQTNKRHFETRLNLSNWH